MWSLSAGDEYDTYTWNCLCGGMMFAEDEGYKQ